MEDGRVEPLLYDFADVVDVLGRVQPFDWAAMLRERLDRTGSDAAFDGLARSGWRLGWSETQSDYAKSVDAYKESADFLHSLGLVIGKEGKLTHVRWNSPGFAAGLTMGLSVVAVNMRAYDADLLREAVTAAKGSNTPPIELLIKDGSDYRIVRIEWHGGLRYPQLERIAGKDDLLTPILTAR